MAPTTDAFELRARRIRRALRHLPWLQPLASRMGTPLWRWYLRRRAAAGAVAAAGPAVVEVDPAAIELLLASRDLALLFRRDGRPTTRGGNWDRPTVRLGDDPLFAALRRHFDGGMPWEGTGFRSALESVRSTGESPLAAPPDDDPERVQDELDRLTEPTHRDALLAVPGPGEGVAVAFDRRGRTCLVSGAGRLAVARAIGLPSLPVRVVVRHRRWARLAIEARAYAAQRGGRAYQPYLHPDLADIPADQGHERFAMLLAALPVRSGVLVDLGANTGYFSHRFEAAGFDCVAVERSEKAAHFLRVLRDACGRRFRIVKGSLTSVDLPARPDVVLALNIFHHLLKTEPSFHSLESFLHRLEARFLLLETHLPDDPQMAGAARDMEPGEFAEWVRRTGGFRTVRPIGSATDGRPLYLLSTDGDD